MTYTETLEYLYGRLPMFSRTGPAAIKPNLDNTYSICEWLGKPQEKFKSIHIAGTNGKGSCSHMLAAIFQCCGYNTALYTSPHLKDFRERIKINGKLIDEEYVVSFTQQLQPLIQKIDPSFFEVTVGMAFNWFAEKKVDIAIIETGLGGRLDSTNVIKPELSIITNIGMDHTNLLGNTLPLIASEKAGIIKEKTPVVIGESSAETDNIFLAAATDRQARIVFADKQLYTADWHQSEGNLYADIVSALDESRISCQLDLQGIYQLKNVITVMEAVHQLKLLGYSLPVDKVLQALKEVKKLTGLHGRWETIHRHPTVVLDVAHNEDGMKQLIKQIELSDYRMLHIVTGMVKDKDVDKVLTKFPAEANYYFTQAQIPRALSADQLMQKGRAAGLEGTCYPDVNAALKSAMNHAHKDDLIVVCGSTFIVGEVSLLHI